MENERRGVGADGVRSIRTNKDPDYNRKYHLKNRERLLAKSRRYYQENKEEFSRKSKERYQRQKLKWAEEAKQRLEQQKNGQKNT